MRALIGAGLGAVYRKLYNVGLRQATGYGLFVASGTLCAVLVTTVNPYAGLVLALLLLTLAIPCLANEKPAHDH